MVGLCAVTRVHLQPTAPAPQKLSFDAQTPAPCPLQAPPPGVGECRLYFGCRRADEDYLFGAELEADAAEGVLTALRVAFSRQQAAHKV